MTIRHLDRLLRPASVAVVGASERPGSVGATVWRNLRAGSFRGPVWPVNPRHPQLDGVPCFASAQALPEAPDLAVVCTPPASVPGVIAALAERGTRAAVVMTAGLDAAQKQSMLDAAKPRLLRILGPNCLGLIAPHAGLNASFSHTDALPGSLAFVSQSGALVTAVLDWAKSRQIGLSHMVSLGESADVDFGDLLDYLASDPDTRSILLYIESIKAPRKFMSAARAAARNKPVIVVKAGRAGQGVAAAASHTGALAGSDIVFDAAIRRAGMLRVDTLGELFMAAETLSRFGANRDEQLTIMTNGGGAGVMAADAAEALGVPLAPLPDALREQLDAVLPANWSRANPIDLIGDAPVERYTATLRALLQTRETGAILFVHAPTAIVRSDDIARACAPIVREASSRVMSSWLGEASVAEARRVFEGAGIADYPTPEDAVHAFGLLRTYRHNQALLSEAPTSGEPCCAGTPDLAAARAAIDATLAEGRTMLDEVRAKQVLSAYGIATVPTEAVGADPYVAAEAGARCGFPVALKILSPQISHKSDVGGVALHLEDEAAVRDAARAMLDRVRTLRPDAQIAGFTVQAMVQRPHAQELIVGASLDPVFGPVILFGHGGTAVEVLADRAIALPPLNRVLARDLIGRTRVAKLLAGYRDHPPARAEAVQDTLVSVAQMLADLPEIAELDINPLWADDRGVIALDARIRVDPGRPAGAQAFAILPYPAELARRIEWNGRPLALRPIRPDDEARHREFVGRLTPEDLRMRFFGFRRDVPRSELARMVQIDYAREMAFVAVQDDDQGVARTLGVARAVADPDNVEAEFAIAVRSDLQGRGLGRLLMQRLIEHFGARGTQRLVGEVLVENAPMRRLAENLGFRQASRHGDAVHLVLALETGGTTRT